MGVPPMLEQCQPPPLRTVGVEGGSLTRDPRVLLAALFVVWVALVWSVWFRPTGPGRIDRASVATPTVCSISAGAVPCS
jgi:hypothetical protein